MNAGALLAGFGADLLAGDPRRLHPVAGFGRTAAALERRAYAPARGRGALITAVLVGGAAAGTAALSRRAARVPLGSACVGALVTWAALGGRSLRRAAERVSSSVEAGDLARARIELRSLCGRDARTLDGPELCRAALESVAENTSDAVVGALAWGALGGAPGVAAYRAANTLDAMFGHRSERYAAFGWAPARLDDLMSWPVARLSSLIAGLCAPLVGGSPRRTLATVRRDGRAHPSPNAGQIEAAFAGALGVTLGGPLIYGERREERPRLGSGRAPEPADVRRANRLSLAVGVVAALGCAGTRAALTQGRP